MSCAGRLWADSRFGEIFPNRASRPVVSPVVEKTTEQEAFENVSTGDLNNDLPDLYGPSSPSCSSLEEAKSLILKGGEDREAGIDYLNEKFGEVMAKPMIEEIMKAEKKKETKDKTSPDRER